MVKVHKNAAGKMPAKTPVKKTPVKVKRVNAALLKEAKKRAGDDYTRLQIVDENTVIIWNSRGQRFRVNA